MQVEILFGEAASTVTAADYEQRVQSFTQGPPRFDWSVPEAFLGVLAAAVHADKQVTPEEAEQLKGLKGRSRILKGMTTDQVSRAYLSAVEKLKVRGDDGLREACECLPSILRLPVFALAVDLVLADGKYTDTEKELIAKIAGLLQVEKQLEISIKDVMLIKNNC